MYEIGQKIELDSGKRLICSPEPTILEDESFCKGCVGRDEEHECANKFCADIRDFTGDICGDYVWTEDLSPAEVSVMVDVWHWLLL